MNRNYIYYEYTQSLCNDCLKQVPAKIIFEDNKVYILKNCLEHGEQEELLEHDVEYYKNKRRFDKPGTKSITQTKFKKGCPYDCGLCTEHDQHSCISLIEITNKCNLACNTCYANSQFGKDLSLEKIEKMLDFAQLTESNNAEVLQISGGEPTVHPKILEVIEMARNKKFKYVMLNTNGLRIAEDEEFVKELSKFVGGFEVYLQFDSLKDEVYKKVRGRELLQIKLKAIERLNKYGIPATLVVTVENGVNDDELGNLIAFGIENKCVRGLNIQPVAYFGRKIGSNERINRSTLTDVIQKIEVQTKKMLLKEDFIPLPCNVERVALTYLYRKNNSFIPITRSNIVEKYLPHINNTFMFTIEDTLKDGKEVLFSSCSCNILNFLKDFKKFVPKEFLTWDIDKRTKYVSENTFRISISSFIDRYNFDTKSMQKECVHIITEDLKRIPFSAYNTIYRGK